MLRFNFDSNTKASAIEVLDMVGMRIYLGYTRLTLINVLLKLYQTPQH